MFNYRLLLAAKTGVAKHLAQNVGGGVLVIQRGSARLFNSNLAFDAQTFDKDCRRIREGLRTSCRKNFLLGVNRVDHGGARSLQPTFFQLPTVTPIRMQNGTKPITKKCQRDVKPPWSFCGHKDCAGHDLPLRRRCRNLRVKWHTACQFP